MFHTLSPVTVVPDDYGLAATSRPCCYAVGPSSDEELDYLAAQALHAGHDVAIVESARRFLSPVHDLYVKPLP